MLWDRDRPKRLRRGIKSTLGKQATFLHDYVPSSQPGQPAAVAVRTEEPPGGEAGQALLRLDMYCESTTEGWVYWSA